MSNTDETPSLESGEDAVSIDYQLPERLRRLSEIFFELGHTYLQQGRYPEAAQAFRDAIREDPDSGELRLELGRVREGQERFEDALRAYLEAVLLAPSRAAEILEKAHKLLTPETARSLGNWLESEWRQAIDNLVLDDVSRAAIYRFLGRASLYSEVYGRAVEQFRQALSNKPGDPYILEGLGEALWRDGQPLPAAEQLCLAVKQADQTDRLDRRASTRLKAARVFVDLKRYDEAIPLIEQGLALKQSYDTEFKILLAKSYLGLDRPEEALQAADEALTIGDTRIEAYAIRADALYRLRRYHEAAAVAEKALELDPNHPPAIRAKALALIGAGTDTEQAIRLLKVYIRNEPTDVDCQLLLARSLRKVGRTSDQAIAALESALATISHEQRSPLLLELAETNLEANRPKEAIAKLNEAESSDPKVRSIANFWQLLGDAYRQIDDRDAALKSYEEGLQVDSAVPALLERYAELLGEGEDLAKTSDAWQAAVKSAPKNANARLKLAGALHRQGNASAALEAVEVVPSLEIDEELGALASQTKGEILESLGRAKEAAEAYNQAGQVRYRQSKFQESVELLQRANGLNPNDQTTYWFWADASRCLAVRTEYPFVDKDQLDRAMEIWKKGYEIGPPSSDYAWSYLIRALVCDDLARLDGDAEKSWWEAIVAIEQSLLLDSENAPAWACLGRCQRSLGQDAMTMQATQRAMSLDKEPELVLLERALTLLNIGDDGAMEAIDNYRKKSSGATAFADGMEAHMLNLLDRPNDALPLVEKALEAVPDEIWYHSVRGDALRLAGQASKAHEEFKWMWEATSPGKPRGDASNATARAWAGYQLGLFREAAEIFKGLLDDYSKDRFAKRIYLALCYLGLNQRLEADSWFNQSLAHFRNRRHGVEAVQDLRLLKQEISKTPESDAVLKAIDEYSAVFAVKAEEATRRPYDAKEGEKELRAVIDGGRFVSDSPPWIAAQAGLARLAAEAERWSDAAQIYQLLLNTGQLPEASRGLDGALEKLRAEGDLKAREGDARKALELFTEALKLGVPPVVTAILKHPVVQQVVSGVAKWFGKASRAAIAAPGPNNEDIMRQAALYSRLGYVHFELRETATARNYFATAIQRYHDSGISEPGRAFAKACQALLRNANDYWSLSDEWKAHAETAGTEVKLRSELAAARLELANHLNSFYQLSEEAGSSFELPPTVMPVMVEIGSALVPQDTGPDWPIIKTYLPEMRARISHEMGVQLPGVQIRGNQDPAPESYKIMIDENLIAGGSVRANMAFCLAPPAALVGLGVPWEAMSEAVHPLTGEVGCWIQPQYREVIANNQLSLWDDPLLFIVFHVEDVLRRNLADFVGVQEVAHLLNSWAQDKEDPLITNSLPERASQFRFARLLRALVKERVPITPWQEILETVQTASLPDRDIEETVRAVRVKLKRLLPGNELSTKRLSLPPELEERIIAWLTHDRGRTFLAIPPEETERLLTAIRALVDWSDNRTVLVVESAELRPFLRRLLELEFPELRVLSREELLSRDEPVNAVGLSEAM